MTDVAVERTGRTTEDVEGLLRGIADLVEAARPVPMSASVLVHRDEVLARVSDALARLPEEVRDARRLLRDREAFLASVQREGDDLLAEARRRAERMVQRTEVVRAAEAQARRTVESAERDARRLRHEADEYCDTKLAEFALVLERTLRGVEAGRARLGVAVLPPPVPPAEADGDPGADLFDQDGA